MMTMEDFRDNLLKYLFTEKKLEEEDSERQKNMSREEKVKNDLLLINVTIKSHENEVYELSVPDNYSKLRAGDKVCLINEDTSAACEATIIDVYFDTLTISCDKELDTEAIYSIEQKSPVLLQTLISCLEGIYSGVPGAAFLRLLSGEEKFETADFLKVDIDDIPNFDSIKKKLNQEQLSAVNSMLEYPPVHVLQGPPGTGKTAVLAATAIATARMNREVVIIANTHHAVNNALLKIRSLDKKATIIKVGAALKSEELDDTVLKFEKFNEYYEYSYKNRRKKRSGHIIGMTIWGAITYLGLRHHAHFRPYIALVDEASLMPLSLAAILGKTAPSVCLFGDSRQMPPIFRPELEGNANSVSILDYCSQKVEGVPVAVLHTTYRMNERITSVVSNSFYEPYEISLHSSESNASNSFFSTYMERKEYLGSIAFSDVSLSTPNCKEENEGEAEAIVEMLKALLDEGKHPDTIAVITPFRKQVRLIRAKAREVIRSEETPLIDTVERLQGQDVDCIILTFATSDENYLSEIRSFMFNPHRLNVMISRAKTKVIIIASEIVQRELKEKLVF
ncbi:MAG: AAA family ATPase [Prevotella sp.]|nr:AAA family ATPase [Prevotella sp.]